MTADSNTTACCRVCGAPAWAGGDLCARCAVLEGNRAGHQQTTPEPPLSDYGRDEAGQRLLSTPGLSDETKRMIRRDLGMLGPEQEGRLRQRVIDNGWRSE